MFLKKYFKTISGLFKNLIGILNELKIILEFL